MIAEKGDLVQRFVNAYMQAFADVIANPEGAADIIVEMNPEYAAKKDVLIKQIEADIKGTFFSADTRANGIGWMTKEAWETTTRILFDQGALPRAINVEAAFSDKYLKGANALKR
jgi:NitT/TauT family transport system substrate-binding protein